MPAPTLRTTTLALALAATLGTLGCSESVDSLVASGEAALGKGDYRMAQIQLKSALQRDLNNVRARWLLGELNLATEDGAAAEKEIRRASELGVGNDAVIPALAQALLLQNKVDAVLELALPPDLSPRSRGEVMAAQGLALLVKGEKGRADELTAEAMKQAPDAKFAAIARASVLIDANKLDDAEQLLTEVQQKYPDYGLGWSLTGDVKDLRGDLPKAEEAFTTAIAKRFSDGPDLLKRAFVRLRQQNLDGALADAERLNKEFPNVQVGWYVAGVVHFQKKNFPKAQEALDRSHQLNNDHLPTLILLGWSNLNVGNLGQAGEQARRVVALAPSVVGARLLMATIDLREQRPQRAEEMVRPVVDAFADNLPAKSLLIESLRAQGKGAEAAPLLEQIAAANPESLDVQTAVALELLRARAPEKALVLLERASERAPESPRVNSALVAALLQEKKFDEALVAAERFHQQQSHDIVALRLLAEAQLAKGDLSRAKATFRKALEVAPGDPKASAVLANLLAQDQDVAGAKKLLDEAYVKHPRDGGLTLAMAQIATREKRADDARVLLAKAIELAPANVLPRLLLSRQLLAENNPQGALDVLPKEVDIKNPLVLAARVDANLQLRSFESARDDLERVVALAPESAPLQFQLASVYDRLGQHNQSERALEEAARLAPKDPNIGLARARAQAAAGRHEEASKTVKALSLPESEYSVVETLLFIAERKGDKAEQIRLAEALFKARPGTLTVMRLVQAMEASGATATAEQTLKEWTVHHPDDEVITLALVQRYGRSERPAEAAALLRPLVAKRPDNAELLNNLAWYLRDSAPAEALVLAEKAHLADPDNPAIIDTYSMALARNGQFDKALRLIDRGIEQAKDPAYLKLQRVEILERSGDKAKAADELESIRTSGLSPALQAHAEAIRQRLGVE